MTVVHAVLLPVGDDLYAVPIDRVREVVAAPPLTRLVTAPPLVLGLFNLRGQIVPLLDTAALLGVGGTEPAAFALVLTSRHGLIGLAATAFPGRASLEASIGASELPGTAGAFRVQGPADGLADGPSHGPAHGRVHGRVAVLLDLDLLLAPERLGRAPGDAAVGSSLAVGGAGG